MVDRGSINGTELKETVEREVEDIVPTMRDLIARSGPSAQFVRDFDKLCRYALEARNREVSDAIMKPMRESSAC